MTVCFAPEASSSIAFQRSHHLRWRSLRALSGSPAVFDVVRAAQAAGVAAAVAGATVHDVDRACREVITAAGFGDAFFTRTGHGLGLEVHEPPSVVGGNHLVLEPGMVITVEPGIYLSGRFGVRIEDTIAITGSAADRLTASDRDLVLAG